MATKKELHAQEVARAVGAGKAVALETVDFDNPNRPKTCLEVDFPILPVNQVASIEGNAGEAALIFWLPQGDSRLRVQASTDAVTWLCEAPHRASQLDFGRLLWSEANEYPQEIVLREGGKPAGLFHLRIT